MQKTTPEGDKACMQEIIRLNENVEKLEGILVKQKKDVEEVIKKLNKNLSDHFETR